MKSTTFILLLLAFFLLSTILLLYKIQTTTLPKYRIESIAVPKDGGNPFQYTLGYLLNTIKGKKKIQIELNNDKFTNQNKIDLIRYEARKLKYTKDTSTFIDVLFTDEVTYGEINQLINMCYDDRHKRFALIKNRFIIFGEYPPRK